LNARTSAVASQSASCANKDDVQQPFKPNPALQTYTGRRKLIGKTVNQALHLTRGYNVVVIHSDEITLFVDQGGYVKGVR